MRIGTHTTDTVPASGQKVLTISWPASEHVAWTMVPTTVGTVPQLEWSIQARRVDATNASYTITVTNKTAAAVSFEARFAVLN